MPELDKATEDALRSSVDQFGVLVPIAVDQYGNIIDGHNRKRIADEIGVECPVNRYEVSDRQHAPDIAIQRHLSVEQRRRLVHALATEVDSMGIGKHSQMAIAQVVGIHRKTVYGDLKACLEKSELPTRRRRSNGRAYSTTRKTSRVVTIRKLHQNTSLIADCNRLNNAIAIVNDLPEPHIMATAMTGEAEAFRTAANWLSGFFVEWIATNTTNNKGVTNDSS